MNLSTRHPEGRQEAGAFSLRQIRYEAGTRQARHHHDVTTATIVFDGSLEEVVGSRREHARALSVVFKPAGTEHANRVGPAGATTLQLTLPADFFGEGRSLPGESDWSWVHGGEPARRFLELFVAWRGREDDSRQTEIRIFDVLGAIDRRPAGRGRPPEWLRWAVEEIEDTYRAPRRVRDIAADAGVHPVALARAHRRCFGCSVSDRIRRRRVEAAAELLGRGVPPGEVAYRVGFSDQPHLTRVFKAETGLTPGRYGRLRRD